MELEMANGYTIVAREFDRNGQSLILAVRQVGEYAFEYVTAWHNRGDSFWNSGDYTRDFTHAVRSFRERVTL